MEEVSHVRSGHDLRAVLAFVTFAGLFWSGEARAAQLTASWIDNSGGQATTRVERRLATDTVFTAIADVPPGVTTYVDRSVSPGTTYCYRALAHAADGVSNYSNEACGTAPADNLNVITGMIGTGTGMVASAPSGINCGSTCSATYVAGTSVTLTATAASGSTFDGWSGGGCTGTAPCTVAGNAAVTITASFSRMSKPLTVTPAPPRFTASTLQTGSPTSMSGGGPGPVGPATSVGPSQRIVVPPSSPMTTLAANAGRMAPADTEIGPATTPTASAPALAVSLVTPRHGTAIQGTVRITAIASLAAVYVELVLDGSVIARSPGTRVTYAWDTTAVGNGTHGWAARAYGADGEAVTEPGVEIVVSNVRRPGLAGPSSRR